MTMKLLLQTAAKFSLGVLLVGLLLFVPAGTINYWQGWLFMAVLFIPMFIAGIAMMIRSPALLSKRLDAREKENEQSMVIRLCALMFIIGFIAAGLNHRFKWCILPDWVSWIGTVLFLIGYLMYAEVLRENTWLSRTVEVQDGQQVVDQGLYGIVRHPMYAATILLFLSIPLVLGSPFTFVIFLAYPFIIARRIQNEEKVLMQGLKGYAEYRQKVRWRMIPLIW